MKSDSDGVYTLLKHILKYKRLFWDGQPRVVDESGSQTQTNENENERQKRIELRRKIQKGALLSLLTFAIIWWRKKQKKSLSQYYSYLRPKALRGGVGPKKGDYHSAVEAPLSVLMLAAKKGMITKALINSNIIAYKIKESQDAATSSNSGLATITTKWKKSALPKDSPSVTKTIMNNITDGGCLDISVLPEPLLTRLIPIFATAFPFIYLFLLYHMMMRLQKGQSDSEDTGKSYSKEGPETTTFADVAGIDTAQVELQEIVSYLSNPKPYLGLGAAPPRGLLIHGKPGLGKTLLARAVAGEAQADHFISCSGSDFVEIYVGQGAKRVRNLFCSARQQAMKKWRKEHHGSGIGTFFKCMLPLSKRKFSKQNDSMFDVNGHSCTRPPTAVLFIDEIDALAKCRGGIGYGASLGGTGGNDEREQTLNALLAEMDGFNRSNVLIIVIAATNRLSLLDPALMRPGRFDRHVALTPPTAEGRESIMKVHARKKKLDQDVDLHELADDKWTFDFSGAELKNVMNEAALLAVRDGSIAIGQNHLHLSTQRVKVMKRYATN